jgi:hypothetical protein
MAESLVDGRDAIEPEPITTIGLDSIVDRQDERHEEVMKVLKSIDARLQELVDIDQEIVNG